MKIKDINLRDPFVLLHNEKYYMYGSRVGEQYGFDVYVSDNLENWSEPKCVFEANADFWGTKDFWAPEVHFYKGKFYMFASFKAEGVCRGTSILVAEKPDARFEIHSERITPEAWECLDGTLYVEDGMPYVIFCREWVQVKDGEVYAVKLTGDLKEAVSEPFILWKASDAAWVSSIHGREGIYVTDGPFLFKSADGKLKSLWSSFADGKYVLATATSDNSSINGKWSIDENLIYKQDGGHGMIFKTKEGKNMISLHAPNSPLNEQPVFTECDFIL